MRPTAYMAAAETVFANQHRTPSSGADTSPRCARNAPNATATSAGTGGNTFSRADSSISTPYVGTLGRRASQSRKASTTRLLLALVGDVHAERVPRPAGM